MNNMPTIAQNKKKQEYINKAREVEGKYNIPPNTLVGLLAQESGHFDENVVSGRKKSYAGAIGIAQFMPTTAKEFKIDPLNVDQAIDAAGKYLSSSYKTFGNWDDAILSYNAGVGRVKEYKGGKPIKIKEHAEYTDRVKNQIKKYGGNLQYKDIPKQQLTTDVNNFAIDIKMSNFAGVPDVQTKEESVKEDKDVKELEQKTNEYNFLQELQNAPERGLAQEEQQVQQQQRIQPQQQNYLQQYDQISQFIDNPFAQQGGEFIKNEIDFLSEIAIKDNKGQWAHEGKITEISSPHITTKGVNKPLIGISKETGERKIMMPNQEYFFKNTQSVIEVPFYKNK